MLSHEPTDLWRGSGCPCARAGARARVGARADDDSQARETSETTGVAHGSDADDFATRDSQADFAQEARGFRASAFPCDRAPSAAYEPLRTLFGGPLDERVSRS